MRIGSCNVLLQHKKGGELTCAYSLSINPKIYFAAFTPHFRFSADMRSGKTPYKRKTAYSAVFQGCRGGIGGDRVQSENL